MYFEYVKCTNKNNIQNMYKKTNFIERQCYGEREEKEREKNVHTNIILSLVDIVTLPMSETELPTTHTHRERDAETREDDVRSCKNANE